LRFDPFGFASLNPPVLPRRFQGWPRDIGRSLVAPLFRQTQLRGTPSKNLRSRDPRPRFMFLILPLACFGWGGFSRQGRENHASFFLISFHLYILPTLGGGFPPPDNYVFPTPPPLPPPWGLIFFRGSSFLARSRLGLWVAGKGWSPNSFAPAVSFFFQPFTFLLGPLCQRFKCPMRGPQGPPPLAFSPLGPLFSQRFPRFFVAKFSSVYRPGLPGR